MDLMYLKVLEVLHLRMGGRPAIAVIAAKVILEAARALEQATLLQATLIHLPIRPPLQVLILLPMV